MSDPINANKFSNDYSSLSKTSRDGVTSDKKEAASAKPTEQYNRQVLEGALTVSVAAGNEPLSLLYQTAIDSINKELEGVLGPNSLQKAYDEGVDVSPEATADRIINGSLGFFASYRANHSHLSEEEAAQKFAGIISTGIDNGFREAREILDSLQVLQGEIAENISKTYDLVQKGIDHFLSAFNESSEQLATK